MSPNNPISPCAFPTANQGQEVRLHSPSRPLQETASQREIRLRSAASPTDSPDRRERLTLTLERQPRRPLLPIDSLFECQHSSPSRRSVTPFDSLLPSPITLQPNSQPFRLRRFLIIAVHSLWSNSFQPDRRFRRSDPAAKDLLKRMFSWWAVKKPLCPSYILTFLQSGPF
jgi:hypothetical protein